MGFRYATLLLVVASFCCGVAGDSNNATEEFTTTVAMTTTPSIETTTEAATTTTIPPTTHEHGPQQPPNITSIDPVTGNTKGGESFTVMGTDLHYDGKSTQVFFTGSAFGERPCLDVRAGDEQVTCKTPSGIGENIAVKISVGDMNATSSMMFNYDAPVVASITPAAVPYTANMTFADYTITIAGTNFGAPSLGTFAAMLQTSAGNNVSLASPTRTSQETATATLAVVGTGSQSEGMARVFVSLDARQSNSLDFWFAKGSPVFDLAVSSDSQPQKDDLQSQLSRLLGVTPKQIFVTSVSAASRRSIALRATTYAVVFQVLSINDSAADEAQTKLEAAARDGTLANTIAGAQSIKAGDGEPVKVEDKNEPSSEGSSGSGGKKGMPGWAIAIIVILVIGVVVLGVIFFRKRQSRRKEGGIEMYEPHNIPSAASFRPDTNVVQTVQPD